MKFLALARIVEALVGIRSALRLCATVALFGLFGLAELCNLLGTLSTVAAAKSVSLDVAILDKSGAPVDEATTSDLIVLVEKQPQTVTGLRLEKDAPISLGVLIDVSRGMGGEGISLALSWLKTLAETLRSPDEIFVNAFSDESQEIVDYISPEDYLAEALDHLGTGGQAHTALAVDLALIKLRDARNPKRALLILSAGRDIAGPATLDHIAKFGFPVYSIGIPGSTGATGTLDRLKNLNLKGSAPKVYAEHSGGEAHFLQSGTEADAVIAKICVQMKNRYRLEYTPNVNRKPGKMLKIEVKSRNPNWEVRYLKRYPASAH